MPQTACDRGNYGILKKNVKVQAKTSNLYSSVMKGLADAMRAQEVHPEVLERYLGREVRERLAQLHPTLIVWDITEKHTSFFLDHRRDPAEILAFVQIDEWAGGKEGLSHEVQWYLQELRCDLRAIIESGAVERGIGSHFAVENRPSAFPPIRPQDWNPQTIAFIDALRPKLAGIIKARRIDHWLQTPLDVLGNLSPIQLIEYGGGDRVLALLEKMQFHGVS